MSGTLCLLREFLQKPLSRVQDEEVIESIAEILLEDLVVEQVEIGDEIMPLAAELEISDVNDDLLQGSRGREIAVEEVGMEHMLQAGHLGRMASSPAKTGDMKPAHGLPDGGISDGQAEVQRKQISNRPISHHGEVGMNVADTGIQIAMRSLVAIHLALLLSLFPLVEPAARYAEDRTELGDGVGFLLLIDLFIHLVNYCLWVSPFFRAECCFRRSTSASFFASSRLSSSI